MTSVRDIIPRNYWRSVALAFPIRWDLNRPFHLPSESSGKIGQYYIDWFPGTGTLGEDWDIAPFDANGVILTPSGARYHPVRIAQYGLHHHAKWLETGSQQSYETFRAQSIWLRDHQSQRAGIGGCYPYDFPDERYGAEPGWVSAMAQGEAISLLLRAHDTEREAGFLESACAAAQPFRHEVREGGVAWISDGDIFFEEVAADPPSHILNGSIYAWWGLWELAKYVNPPWLVALVDDGLATLRRNLPRYDSGYWSYYDMLATREGFRKTATLKYHAFHIAQLRVLAAMTGDAYFDRVATKWQEYVGNRLCRVRALRNTVAGLWYRFFRRSDTVPGGAQSILP